MKYILSISGVLMLAFLISGQISSAGQGESNAPGQQKKYADGEVLVKYREGVTEQSKSEKRKGLGAQKIHEIKRARISRLKLGANKSVEDAISELMSDPDVEYAEPNYIRRASWVPNDTEFATQWDMTRIDAKSAWDIENSCAPVIAVIDSGVSGHVDLNSQFWINSDETNCNDSNDDDGNGYISDCNGWNFVDNNNVLTDGFDHGTHVAGVIAAEADNSEGIAGVCGGGANIMTLKVLDNDGIGYVSDEVDAIYYALDNGAKVINLSLGGIGCSMSERVAIKDFGEAGGLIVAASGNNGRDNDTSLTPEYPASFDLPYIISVAASDAIDGRATFTAGQSSHYGYWSVDIAAPGTNILSTLNNGSYGPKQGTSMATPHVTGAVALINTVFPHMTNLEIKQQLLGSVDALSPNLAGLGNMLTSGGRLNLYSALLAEVPIAPTSLTVTSLDGGNAELNWTDNSSDETGFIIQRINKDGYAFANITITAANAITYTDSTAPSIGAYYRVIALNDSLGPDLLSDYSNIDGFKLSGTTIYTRGGKCPGSGGGGGGCFIATAAYGTTLTPQLDTLRHLRDGVLMRSDIGRSLVNLYYRNSPPLAERISRHASLRATCRGAIWPIIIFVRHPFALLILVTLILLALSGVNRNKQEDK